MQNLTAVWADRHVAEVLTSLLSRVQSCPGLEQYAIKKFAEAFESVPRALAGNSGVKGNVLISKLYSEHHEGNKNMGFDIEVSNVLYLKHILCHFILL